MKKYSVRTLLACNTLSVHIQGLYLIDVHLYIPTTYQYFSTCTTLNVGWSIISCNYFNRDIARVILHGNSLYTSWYVFRGALAACVFTPIIYTIYQCDSIKGTVHVCDSIQPNPMPTYHIDALSWHSGEHSRQHLQRKLREHSILWFLL